MRKWWLGVLRDTATDAEGGGSGSEGLPPAPPSAAPPASSDVERLAAQIQQQGETINRIVGVIRQMPSTQQSPPAQGPPATAAAAAAEPKDPATAFWRDPVGVSQTIARQAAQEAAANNPAFDTLVATARQTARGEDPEVFDLLAAEIAAKVATMPPQFQQSATVWTNAFNISRGENFKKVMDFRTSKSGAPVSSAVAGLPPSPRAPEAPKKQDLTEEEKSFVRKFGTTEDGYRAGKLAFNNQGSGKPNEPSSWDEVITFDSELARRRRKEAAAKGGK